MGRVVVQTINNFSQSFVHMMNDMKMFLNRSYEALLRSIPQPSNQHIDTGNKWQRRLNLSNPIIEKRLIENTSEGSHYGRSDNESEKKNQDLTPARENRRKRPKKPRDKFKL